MSSWMSESSAGAAKARIAAGRSRAQRLPDVRRESTKLRPHGLLAIAAVAMSSTLSAEDDNVCAYVPFASTGFPGGDLSFP